MARRGLLASIAALFGLSVSRAPAEAAATTRLSFEASVARLRELGLVGADETVALPDRMPRHDDEEPLGVSIFRTGVSDVDLSGLTLPRTYVGRSEIARAAFRNTDLSESNLCWNDFIEVDFSDASLAKADLRASLFETCRFDRADLTGAIVTRGQIDAARLSASQHRQIDWRGQDEPEPDGG